MKTDTTSLLARTAEALDRLHNAVKDLAAFNPESKLTYFEESPTKNQVCFERFKELGAAQAGAHTVLEIYATYKKDTP
jgi:hypothetical protein